MILLDTVIGVFLKEGAAYLTGSLKEVSTSKKSVARRFYMLYQSLQEVQETYFVCVAKDRSEISLEIYDDRLRDFDRRIRELRDILGIYDDQLYGHLQTYSDMSGPLDPGSAIARNLRWTSIDNSDFYTAKEALAKFIRENFDIKDLLY